MMNLKHICEQVIALNQQVGKYILAENKKLDKHGIESKGANNFVTYVDKEAETQLVTGLREILPGAGFLTEEGVASMHGEDYFWVVDPIDGTTNFIQHLSPYSISIALMKGEQVLLGCVYEISLDEMFYAWHQGGAWLNGKPIHVSEKKELAHAVVSYGIPYELKPEYDYLRQRILYLYGKCTVRLLGSAAAELCYVASGRLDGYLHDNLSPWDVAAGTLIIKEAGGTTTDFSLGANYIFGKELLSTNKHIHQELMDFMVSPNSD